MLAFIRHDCGKGIRVKSHPARALSVNKYWKLSGGETPLVTRFMPGISAQPAVRHTAVGMM